MINPFRIKGSLTTKLSLLGTASVLMVLAVLGLYFDAFLKESFLDSTQKRMQHGYKRLALNLRNIERELRDGVAFLRSDSGLIASIELVNNYQDKNNYNTFLIDEEKKAIANELLHRVKLSFNSDIVIYDHNMELVAYVVKQGSAYQLYYLSFSGGQRQLFSRHELQSEFAPTPFSLPPNITPVHISHYPDSMVISDSLITYHQLKDSLVVKSHQSMIDPDSGRVIAHVELSHLLGPAYFEQLSQDLDLNLSLSFDYNYYRGSVPLREGADMLPVAVEQNDQEYIGSMRRDTNEGDAYFLARLNKRELHTTLTDNRQRFLLLLLLVATLTLLVLRLLIHGGLARPLGLLMGQIRRIEQGDYATRAPVATGDELESIATSVNQLATAVQEREASLKQSRQELRHLSNHDPLTDLPNRRFFTERLQHALDLAKRRKHTLAVFFLDLDQFKLVNDTLGHDLGDNLLVQVAERLRGHARSADTLARIGGDEFNLLVESPGELHELEVIVAKYLELFQQPFHCQGNEISTTVSIGVSLYPRDGEDSVTLIKHADLAMYQAKDHGRNSYSFFSNEMSEQVRARASMTHALQEAIEAGDQFQLYYQPKISLHTGRMEAVEALIRWDRPQYGMVSPGQFIPLAEETGQIVAIGRWVLQRGCQDFMRLRRQGVGLRQISLNLSNVQMRQDDISDQVRRAIAESGIQPRELELEITESYIATDVAKAISTLQGLRAMGVLLSVDDFGTGYSSMSYLQKLPVTRIKVDKSFVDGLPHDRDSGAITRAIISLAKNFELEVTAEGVEREDQLQFLKQEGCDEIQGYYFAKPMPLAELEMYYRQQTGADNVISLAASRPRETSR